MTTPVGLGIPFPKMLPITGTWVLPFAAYGILLSGRVVSQRMDTNVLVGDSSGKERTSDGPQDQLRLASRAHANFVENVPLALVLAAVAELNGANKRVLNYTLGVLLALRVAHVEFGMRGNDEASAPGRPLGYLGTQGVIAGLAGYGTYLVKGYWGL